MNQAELAPGVWHLEEDYRVYCTLVQGKDQAILWDTGQGKQDLAAYLAERVQKNTEQLYASVINALFEAPKNEKKEDVE